MRKLKENKGITLVALIITVIVLLILTVVAIRAITGEGVLDKAKTATNSYEDKRREEENMLGSYADMIDANMPQNTEGGEDGVKYYYTDYVEVRGIGYVGVITVKDFENNYKEVILHYSNGQVNFSRTYEPDIAETDVTIGNIEIKQGTVLYTNGGGFFIIGDSLYLADGPNNYFYEFKLTNYNTEIQNIIDSAVPAT